ncbi:type II toxin-antitoxin system death-on-curing family toxin [bacterium]|nr:type II toxin-antitoxin system death-on-curing family toxin [bacterium]
MDEIVFLTVEDALEAHRLVQTVTPLEPTLLLNPEGLDSAIAMAQQSAFGEYVHKGIFEMAAAYLYHLALAHPFQNGNKRVAAMCALMFLEANGVYLAPDDKELEALVLDVIAHRIDKAGIARILEMWTSPQIFDL